MTLSNTTNRAFFWRKFFVAIVIGLLLGGCATTVSKNLPVASSPHEDTNIPFKIGAFNSVSGLATVRVNINGESFGGSHALFAMSPDKLRAELYGLFGRPIYLLVSDGESLTYLLPGENRYFKSPSTGGIFYRLTHIPLAGENFVGLLLGRLPTIENAELQSYVDIDGNVVVTRSDANGLSQELRFDSQGHLLLGRLWQGDHLLLAAEYSDHTDEGFAATIQMEFPDSHVHVSVEFDAPTIDAVIPSQRFKLAIPEDATRIELNNS